MATMGKWFAVTRAQRSITKTASRWRTCLRANGAAWNVFRSCLTNDKQEVEWRRWINIFEWYIESISHYRLEHYFNNSYKCQKRDNQRVSILLLLSSNSSKINQEFKYGFTTMLIFASKEKSLDLMSIWTLYLTKPSRSKQRQRRQGHWENSS